jgi:peptide chain release factor subunit 1
VPDDDALRRIAAADTGGQPVLSVYVDLDPARFATSAARTSAFTSVVDEAHRAAEAAAEALGREARKTLRADVERVRDHLDSSDYEGTRGLAIFAAGDGLFEALHLPHPVETAVAVDASPHLAPLARGDDGVWCVVLVSRRNGRILRGGSQRLLEMRRVTDDVHGQHDQGGWSQSRYQRGIDLEFRRHVERVVEALRDHRRRAPFDHLLVGGPEDAYTQLRELLDEPLRGLLRGRVEIDVDVATPSEALAAAQPPIAEQTRREHDELLATLAARLGSDGSAAAGLDDVLGCLDERRVEALLLDVGFAAEGGECPACGWLTAIAGGECPACGASVEPRANVVDAAVERALAQDARVIALRERPELGEHGGVAALLRF